MTKNELREKIRAERAGLDAGYMQTAGSAIAGRVLADPAYMNSRVIFVYASMADEPDTARIIDAALADGRTVCVPKCRAGHVMDAVRIDSRQELQPGAYGIPEPAEGGGTVPPEQIDLMIVPCVSAYLDGSRLGHGAGYYDRYMEQTRAKKMCLCFDRLMSEDIPMGEHDIYMDIVITERETLRI